MRLNKDPVCFSSSTADPGRFRAIQYAEVSAFKLVYVSGAITCSPTDTIWGLGCSAENQDGIEKLSELKERKEGKNYLVLVSDERMLNNYVQEIPEVAYDLLDNVEEPLTIVYPKCTPKMSHLAASDGSIAIRMVKDQFCLDLIKRLRAGLVSTSANFSGQEYKHSVPQDLKDRMDYCCDVPLKEGNKPSKMIKLSMNGEFKIIRG